MADERMLLLRFIGDSASARKAATEVTGSTQKMGKDIMAIGGQVARGLALIGATAWLKKSVDAAAVAQQSQARLAASVEATGESYADFAHLLDSTVAAAVRRSAYDDEDLADAIGTLNLSTKNTTRSMELLSLVTDVARGKKMDLGKAAELVGKIDAGNLTLLKRYGIVLDENATKEEALAALRERFAGQSEAFANSYAGQQAQLQVALGNLQETVGAQLLPMLTKATITTTELVNNFNALPAPVKDITFKLAGLTAGLLVVGQAAAGLVKMFTTLGISSAIGSSGIGGLAAGAGALLMAINPIVIALGVFIVTLMDVDDAASDFAKAMVMDGESLENTRKAVEEGITTWDALAAAVQTNKINNMDAATKMEILKNSSLGLNEMTATMADVTEEAGFAQDELTRAMDGTLVKMNELSGMTRTLTELELAVRTANLDVADAERRRAEALDEHGQESAEYERACINLETAELRAADAAADLKAAEDNLGANREALARLQAELDMVRNLSGGWADLEAQIGHARTVGYARFAGAAMTSAIPGHAAGAYNPGFPQVDVWGEDGPEYKIPASARYRAQAVPLVGRLLNDMGMAAGVQVTWTGNIVASRQDAPFVEQAAYDGLSRAIAEAARPAF